jgi:hypothetical protein
MRLSNIALSLTALYGAGGFARGSSLALDFISGNRTLDPRITFSRTTNATVTGSNGLIQNAPMNLLTHSEQFDNAAWLKTTATVTANAAVAPNGTTTADKLIANSGASVAARVRQEIATNAATYSFSVVAKAAEFTQLYLYNSTAVYDAYFNLADGTLGAVSGGASSEIENLGDGWYRCTLTGTATAGTNGFRIYVASNGSFTVTGNGVDGIYIWGAQLELGSTATTYNPTTVKNLLGFTENFDNAAWTKSNSFVQTNQLLYSQDFDNAYWSKLGGAITANTTTAPDGTNTADTLTEDTSTNLHIVFRSVPVISGTTYTLSYWVKRGTGARDLAIRMDSDASGRRSFVNLSTGVVTANPFHTVTATASGSYWYVTCTVTATATTSVVMGAELSSAGVGTFYTGDGTSSIDIWGAQVVQGTSAGDYKATYAAAAAVGYTDIYGQPFAQKLVENTATDGHEIRGTATVAAAPYTFSCYLKADGRNFAMLFISGINTATVFNLATGATAGNAGFTAPTSAAITSVGNGWYRCSVTATTTAASLTFRVYMMTDATTFSYTGDGTSGIYIFGAQLSDSASVDPYVYQPVAAPTSTAYYGPRFDYDPVTLAPKGLLIEEQRTNLLLRSEEFDNAA